MRVLIGCERSGVIRDAFRARGHDAWSCDIKPCESDPHYHLQGDIKYALAENNGFYFRALRVHKRWDLLIAHPECRYLSSSGLHWNTRRPERSIETDKALAFVRALWSCNVSRICIENPQGCINTRIPEMPKPQYIQPYQFGHNASKKTGLWLKNLPPLVIDLALYVQPRTVDGKPRWANQTDSGQNRLAPSATRSMDRARTYKGIATAMAEQWGSL